MKRALLIVALVFLISLPSTIRAQATCPSDITGVPDSQLQALLDICEKEIADNQSKLNLTQKTAMTIQNVIDQLKYKIEKANLDIKAHNIKIIQLSNDITVRNRNIDNLNDKIGKMKDSVAEIMRKGSELSNTSPVVAILSTKDLSEFFVNLDNYQVLQDKLHQTILAIKDARSAVEQEKSSLEDSKVKESVLKAEQEDLKRQTQVFQKQQQEALKVTQAQAKTYAAQIAEKQRVRNEIANRIFRTVGGTELRFEDALKLVRIYANKIGVSPSLTLAVLSQESSSGGLIGKNIGKCTYNQSASNPAGTVMSPSQVPSYLAIMNELGLDANTTPVSCPIYSDGAYGGAMGPAQFMPTTWWNVGTQMGFKQRVAQVMGVSTPSPFKNLDAFTGTALYLSDAQDRCEAVFSDTFKIRACTAAKYYAGLTVSGTKLARHMNPVSSYGYQVASRAAQFDRDIATLDQ